MSPADVQTLIAGYYRPCIPLDTRYPSDDCERVERYFGCVLPPTFRAFRSLLPGYCVEGDHLPPDEIEITYQSELEQNPNFTKDHLPFYSVGNGDHICLSVSGCPNSPVVYVAHDDPTVSVLADSFEVFLHDSNWWP